MLNIAPIRLLKGCHPSTGDTGSGCFLNVCSYLQGDKVITDRPTSVSAALRAPLIILNDLLPDAERQALLPFVHRAMLTGAQHRLQDTVDALSAFGQLAHDLAEIGSMLGRKVSIPSRADLWTRHSAAVRSGLTDNFADEVAFALKNVLKMLGDGMWRDRINYVKAPTLEDYTVDASPTNSFVRHHSREIAEVAVEKIVVALDKALPSDMEPRPIVAVRAALLVEVSKEWGDKPLPRSKDEHLFVHHDHNMTAKAMLAVMEMAMPAHLLKGCTYDEFLIGMDFSKDLGPKDIYAEWSPGKPAAVKKNTPHGPIKSHKPLYI